MWSLTITTAQMFTISDAETFLETYNSDWTMLEFYPLFEISRKIKGPVTISCCMEVFPRVERTVRQIALLNISSGSDHTR